MAGGGQGWGGQGWGGEVWGGEVWGGEGWGGEGWVRLLSIQGGAAIKEGALPPSNQ